MTVYYIEDPNGTYFSEDGTRRFIKLSGEAAYDYLKTDKGKDLRFLKITDAAYGEETINIEIPRHLISAMRVDERNSQYTREQKKQSDIAILSLEKLFEQDDGDDYYFRYGFMEDRSADVEQDYLDKERVEHLHKVLLTLTEDEFALICALYLQQEKLTESGFSSVANTSQQVISYQKRRILKKMKKFLK